jgi:flagellar motor switch protein FliM
VSDKKASAGEKRAHSLRSAATGTIVMADILDQTEVDALLTAVAANAAEAVPAGADFAAAECEKGFSHEREVADYDFKRPERVSKEQMRALQSIHEAFARNFGASLSAFLRAIVDIRVATTEQLTYGEFIHSLPSPTCLNLLSAPQLNGQLCLELSPLIVYPIVTRLLGGTNTEVFIPQRPLTAIEMRLVSRTIDRALVNLTEAWSDAREVHFEVAGTESNPHLVQIVAPNELVVVVGFEIKIGARAGTMSICLPFNVIEPLVGKLAVQSWSAYSRGTGTSDQMLRVTRNLRKADVELRAYLGQTTIRVRDLLSLVPGDILQLDKLVERDFVVRVEGQNKYAGRAGQVRGFRAIQVTRRAAPDELL